MPEILLRGIKVDFPKEPYPCQVAYMEKVIQALQLRQNALLESPTGTGKTLCLLCATLAWQKHLIDHQNKNLGTAASGKSSTTTQVTAPMIIYASRTHSQLAQVVDELRTSSYRPKMTVLGSREQLCVHDKVSKLKGAVMNHTCNAMNSKHACPFKNGLDNLIPQGGTITGSVELEIADIEDLVREGKKQRICPYFYTREISQNCNIVFMPYNYLLDSTIRKTLKVHWENAIVIFDEAHNLERVASDAASFTFSTADIAACIEELQQVVRILRDGAIDQSSQSQKNEKAASEYSGGTIQRPSIENAVHLLQSMFALEQKIDALRLYKEYESSTDHGASTTLPGHSLIEIFGASGFMQLSDKASEEVKRCANMLMEEAESALELGDSVLGGGSAPTHAAEPKLNMFASALDRVSRSLKTGHADYRMYVCEEKIKQFFNRGETKVGQPLVNKPTIKRVVNYWCFSTGVALKELTDLGIRSVILTSGTLSPMEAMKEDLRIPFNCELQNPHVIESKQMIISAVACGSNGKSFNSSFANRDSNDYKDELGHSIHNIYRTMMEAERQVKTIASDATSKGGILVFFPSYTSMESTVDRWKATGMFDTLKHSIGGIIVEPKGNVKAKVVESNKTLNVASTPFMAPPSRSQRNRNSDDLEDENFVTVVDEFNNAIRKFNSCLLLAVCRGKVSEGIDFSNNKGRVVIVTGIPFAPFKDPWVMLKKSYLDDKMSKSNSSTAVVSNIVVDTPSSNSIMSSVANGGQNSWSKAKNMTGTVDSSNIQFLNSGIVGTNQVPVQQNPHGMISGQMWYQQSASRAVNQCLGRVIRHKNDWGAIFLLDERFHNEGQLAQLSTWMRPRVKKFKSLNDELPEFRRFLVDIAKDPSLRYVEKILTKVANIAGPSVVVPFGKKAADNPVRRVVELSMEDIKGSNAVTDDDDDQTYLNPMLLSSQSVTVLPSRSNTSSRGVILNDTIPMFPIFQARETKPITENVIEKMMKKDGPLSYKANVVTSSRPLSSFGLQSNTKLNVPESVGDFDSVSQSEGFAKQTFQFGLSSGGCFASSSRNILSDDPIFSQSQSQSASLSLTQPLASTSVENPLSNVKTSLFSRKSILSNAPIETKEQHVKTLILQLKPHMSKIMENQFKALISKSRSVGGMSKVSQIHEFIEKLIEILKPLPLPTLRSDVVMGLCALVNDRTLAAVYQDKAKQLLTAPGAAIDGNAIESVVEHQHVEDLTQPLPSSSSSSIVKRAFSTSTVLDEDLSNVGTKRAKRLIQHATSGGNKQGTSSSIKIDQTNNARDNLLSKLQELNHFDGIKPGISNAKALGSEDTISRLKCIICKDASNNPCAARCGHICCQECWLTWLKVSNTCPLCKHEASINSITRIKLKEGY